MTRPNCKKHPEFPSYKNHGCKQPWPTLGLSSSGTRKPIPLVSRCLGPWCLDHWGPNLFMHNERGDGLLTLPFDHTVVRTLFTALIGRVSNSLA